MNVLLNGEPTEFAPETTLLQAISRAAGNLIAGDGMPDGGTLAVGAAVDGHIVPRSAWRSTVLLDGAVVEICEAMQHGDSDTDD